MPVKDNPLSSNVQLAFLADRVVNSLSIKEGYSNDDKLIFSKAESLLNDALVGHDVVVTGRLQARALELIGAYGVALSSYAAVAENRRATQKEDIQEVISEFRNNLAHLSSGEQVEENKLINIKDFFTMMRDISLRNDVDSFDNINIGTKFSYGAFRNR